ncbi:MAG: family 20 glycosylhydrolase [Planctomycetes bacterium]|nr:family 20 glycosylhydrolase [Planctomycetota bacterium]
MSASPSIWPAPQSTQVASSVSCLNARLQVTGIGPEHATCVEHLRARLAAIEIEIGSGDSPLATGVHVSFGHVDPRTTSREAYALALQADGITLRCASERALYPAFATLVQHLRGMERAGSELRGRVTRYVDWPTFVVRGVMLDVSRTRVPRMETLYAIVERLAAWKINQLQLYMEHTFAYVGHDTVWRDASPFTADEIRALDRFCLARGVELVPNQQSFGHMHRWLKHARYRDLAEVPEGVEHAFSIEREPYSLDLSDPRAGALLDDLYDQLLPCFTSKLVNVGLDETFDLGLGRARAACEERGVERVYLEYLKLVHAKIRARGRTMQFWGDIIVKRPELVPELPRDAIALEWGYDAGHPFAEHAAAFRTSGLQFYVCPGTSSWQSLGGRSDNLLANLSEAARHGAAAHANGYLVTDWGDRGHLQPRVIAEPGLALGAGCAWNANADLTDRALLERILDEHVFEDEAGVMGALVLDLGRAGDVTGAKSTNGSPLFFLLAFAREPLPHARIVDPSTDGLQRARGFLAELRERVARIRSSRTDAALLADELRFVIDLLIFACDFGCARLAAAPGSAVPAIALSVRRSLATRLRPLIAEHRRLWLVRERPGGLDESAAWLERVLALLEQDAPGHA